MISSSRIYAILKKEFTQLKRDRSTFAMILLIPIVQLLLFGYAINNDPKHLPTAVISRDNSIFARSFITGLKNSEYFNISSNIRSDEEGRELLQKGKVQFVITIPENYGRDLIRGNIPDILVEADATDPTATMGAIAALNGILDSVLERDLKDGFSQLIGTPPPVNIIIHKLYNPEGFTRYNIVPGLIGMVLTLTGVMMTALALTKERERGTMENLLAMPVKAIEVMVGKIAPYVLIGYFQSMMILLAAKFLFDVPIIGSLWLLSLSLIFFIICNLSLGFSISTVAKNQTQAMQMSFMVFLPSIMLTGFMFPFVGMPNWAQSLGSLIPMTYFVRIVRAILLKGGTFVEIWPNLWPLMLFMVLISAFTIKVYKKTLD